MGLLKYQSIKSKIIIWLYRINLHVLHKCALYDVFRCHSFINATQVISIFINRYTFVISVIVYL